MSTARGRMVESLAIPTGRRLLSVLPALQEALAGRGPALVPVPLADPPHAAKLESAFAVGTELSVAEDDDSDPTALVIATSGSTGTPKGSLLSANALASSSAATAARLGSGRWLLALPAYHIAGMQVLLRSAAAGAEPDILDTAAPFTSAAFVEAVSAMGGGDRFVSLVPTQLHRLITGPAEGVAALASFSAVLVGGAATPAQLLDQARAAGVQVATTYGMSETCGGCVYDGLPLDGVEVSLSPGTGRISLNGPMVARGYRGMPDHPAFPGSGTFRTDDIGSWDGTLTVLGRMDDVIVTGGVKVSPGAVESTIAGLPGVGEVVLTSVPDDEWGQKVVAVLTLRGLGSLDLAVIRAAVRQVHGPAAAPRKLVVVDQIPVRGPGKPDRAAVQKIAAARLGE